MSFAPPSEQRLDYAGVFELRKLRLGGGWGLVKGPARRPSRQSLATEFRVSRAWQAPLRQWEPRVRLPQVWSYDAAGHRLWREWIEGRRWRFAGACNRTRERRREEWQALGRWLGGLHRLSRRGRADPWSGLITDWEKPSVEAGLRRLGLPELHPEVLRQLRCRQRQAPLAWPQCRLHGDFSPAQILETPQGLAVLDLASSRRGMDFEDLASWLAYCDLRLPRRRRCEWRAFYRGYGPAEYGLERWRMELQQWARMRALVRWTERGWQRHGCGRRWIERLRMHRARRRLLHLSARLERRLPRETSTG